MSVVKGKVIDIWAPNLVGFFKAMNPFIGTIWSLYFKCGSCGVKSIVQHDENKEYHKCPACDTVNSLDKKSYYDIYN